MNFLAHIYLSGNNKLLMIGNFIGDFIKGKQYTHLPEMVQKGVLLHREIDFFTDQHPINKDLRKILYPEFGKYAGVFLDMFQDHILASNWKDFSKESLQLFCLKAYFNLFIYYKYLPDKARTMARRLISQNRLRTYASLSSLKEALDIMSRSTSLPAKSQVAIDVLMDNYDKFKNSFYLFFPEIITHTSLSRVEKIKKSNIVLPDPLILQELNKSHT